MDDIKGLELSLERATADLARAQAAHQTCLLNRDEEGCAEECAALTAAERRVHAGEVGEVVELHKKLFFKPGYEATREQALDELADATYYLTVLACLWEIAFDDLFAHLARKLAGGHGWVKPSNSTGLEDGDHA